ncbi:MAG: hypothetical protein NXI30_04670 [bacterium]|nr:hypothetical protein [bacterium]
MARRHQRRAPSRVDQPALPHQARDAIERTRQMSTEIETSTPRVSYADLVVREQSLRAEQQQGEQRYDALVATSVTEPGEEVNEELRRQRSANASRQHQLDAIERLKRLAESDESEAELIARIKKRVGIEKEEAARAWQICTRLEEAENHLVGLTECLEWITKNAQESRQVLASVVRRRKNPSLPQMTSLDCTRGIPFDGALKGRILAAVAARVTYALGDRPDRVGDEMNLYEGLLERIGDAAQALEDPDVAAYVESEELQAIRKARRGESDDEDTEPTDEKLNAVEIIRRETHGSTEG